MPEQGFPSALGRQRVPVLLVVAGTEANCIPTSWSGTLGDHGPGSCENDPHQEGAIWPCYDHDPAMRASVLLGPGVQQCGDAQVPIDSL